MKKKLFILLILIMIFQDKFLFSNELPLHTIKIKNYQVEYYYGGKKPPYFLLVHGLGVDKTSFYELAHLLGLKYDYKVLLPDIPGQGNTERIPEMDYSVENMADYLNEFIKKLKISKAVVVGNSMGGHIATVFTLKYPKVVQTLVLINPSGIEFNNQKPYQFIPEETFKDIKDPQIVENLKWNNKIRKDIQNNQYYVLNPYLKNIKTPTILFWGSEDNIIPYVYSSVWATEIPNLCFYVLKGGHLLQKEQPEKIIEKILHSKCK